MKFNCCSKIKKKACLFLSNVFNFYIIWFCDHLFAVKWRGRTYKDYYMALGLITGIFVVAIIVIFFLVERGLKKQRVKFSNEKIRRINREAAKDPKVGHVLITQDVIAYALWNIWCGIRLLSQEH